MAANSGDTDLFLWAFLWIAVALFVFVRHWHRDRGVGLLMTYVASFGAVHWLAAAVYLLPWCDVPGRVHTIEGLRLSTIGIVALAVGSEALTMYVTWRHPAAPDTSQAARTIDDRFSIIYLISGFLLYLIVSPKVHGISGLNALASTGSLLIVVGIVLRCWNAWQDGRRWGVWRWLAAAGIFPIMTVAAQGFLGYGFAAALTVFAFVASLYRPRWRFMIAAVILGYCGMSVYVTYMRDRADIRDIVWKDGSLNDRVSQLASTFASAEWFDPGDQSQLGRVSDRMNQDYLVGAAASYLEAGRVEFAMGSTLVDAALSLVPRVLWTEKSVGAGSGDLVSKYTGMDFDINTSVGIGQVMECYVNFGTAGIIGGFFVIGAVLTLFDRSANRALRQGSVESFVLWYLPGLSLLQVGGSFVDVVGTAGAAFAVALIFNRLTPFLGTRTITPAALVPPEAPVED